MIFPKSNCYILYSFVALLFLTSCRKENINKIEDIGAQVNVTGTWEGSWTKSTTGMTFGGTISIFFQQEDSLLNGTMTIQNDACYLSQQPIQGSIQKQHLNFIYQDPAFPINFTAISDQYGKLIGGSFSLPVDCEGEPDVQGNFELSKKNK